MIKATSSQKFHLKDDYAVPATEPQQLRDFLTNQLTLSALDASKTRVVRFYKNMATGQLSAPIDDNIAHNYFTNGMAPQQGVWELCHVPVEEIPTALAKSDQHYRAQIRETLLSTDNSQDETLTQLIFNQQIAPDAVDPEFQLADYLPQAVDFLTNSGYPFNSDLFTKTASLVFSKGNRASKLATELWLLGQTNYLHALRDLLSSDQSSLTNEPLQVALDFASLSDQTTTAVNVPLMKKLSDEHRLTVYINDPVTLLIQIRSPFDDQNRRFLEKLVAEKIPVELSARLVHQIETISDQLPDKTPLDKGLKNFYLSRPLLPEQDIKSLLKDLLPQAIDDFAQETFNPIKGISALYAGLSRGYSSGLPVSSFLVDRLPKTLRHVLYATQDYYNNRYNPVLEEDGVEPQLQQNSRYYDTGTDNRQIFDILSLGANPKHPVRVSTQFEQVWKSAFGESFAQTCQRITEPENDQGISH